MNSRIALIAAGIICFALVPIVPYMLRLRIGILRRLHWNWFADLHENHFDGFVLFARVAIFLGGVVALVMAARL